MEKEIKELRVKIDGLAQLTKSLKPLTTTNLAGVIHDTYNSREINKSVDSLYLAKAWLGKVLAELGVESPYKAGYKEVKDIEPTADVNNCVQDKTAYKNGVGERDYCDFNHIEKVDWLRSEIEKLIQEVSKISSAVQSVTREFAIARTNCYNYLCEARFWLGFELQRIKENGNSIR